MTNLALAPDVKCYHAQAAIDATKAKKYGLSCEDDTRKVRMSTASALAWIDKQEKFEDLTDDAQYMLQCMARDLERVITVNWVCPPDVVTEECDDTQSCGNIQLVDVDSGECVTPVAGSPEGTIGYMLPASEPKSGIDLYQLGIIDKTDARYYTKSEIDRKLGKTSGATFLVDSRGYNVPANPTAPVTPPGGAVAGDIAIETYADAIVFWKRTTTGWSEESRHIIPKGEDTKVISVNTAWTASDDLIVINASAGPVDYTLPLSPTDNLEVSVMASDITNAAEVDGNGNAINGQVANMSIFEIYRVYKLRWSSALNTWIIL